MSLLGNLFNKKPVPKTMPVFVMTEPVVETDSMPVYRIVQCETHDIRYCPNGLPVTLYWVRINPLEDQVPRYMQVVYNVYDDCLVTLEGHKKLVATNKQIAERLSNITTKIKEESFT